MRDAETVLTDLERLVAFEDAERTFQMTEDAFRTFYDATARMVWVYLARMTGDARLADDLLQETYYRFLRTRTAFADEDHRRNYLFRIATNLVRDHRRRPRVEAPPAREQEVGIEPGVQTDATEDAVRRIDLARALERLQPRDRSLLWLAYAQGCSHEEIAAQVGVKRSSLKVLLHRARQRLLRLLGGRGARGGQP